jgi:AraC-like DNA-binding protein
MQEFSKYIKNHSQTNPAIVPRTQQDYRYVSQLLDAGGSHHPYRHLLFGTWLLGEASQVFSNLPEANFSNMKNTPEIVNNISNKCLKFLKAGKSLAHTSRETGKSRCYLKRIALLNGISLNLKPKTLTQQVIDAICTLAYSGFHRREIARRCGVGIGSVEQTISSHSGLVERRKQCHFQSARRKNRFVILKYLGSHPESIRNDVKQQCSSAFYWLYLNDRAWLEEKLPIACKPKGRY